MIPFKVSQILHSNKSLKISGELNCAELSTKKFHPSFQRKNKELFTLRVKFLKTELFLVRIFLYLDLK